MKKQKNYESPECEIIQTLCGAVLCFSMEEETTVEGFDNVLDYSW